MIYVEARYRNVFSGEEATYRGPAIRIARAVNKHGEEVHVIVVDPMTTITVRPGEYVVSDSEGAGHAAR